jgi:hypothetical protein
MPPPSHFVTVQPPWDERQAELPHRSEAPDLILDDPLCCHGISRGGCPANRRAALTGAPFMEAGATSEGDGAAQIDHLTFALAGLAIGLVEIVIG